MPLQFYYNPASPPSKAVWMLLEEMEIEYELHFVDLATGQHKQEEYKKVNPLCQVPAIVDGSFQLWESRAILQYLASQYRSNNPKFYPEDAKSKAIIDMVLYSDSSAYDGKILPYLNVAGVMFGGGDVAHDKLDGVKESLRMYDNYIKEKKGMGGDHITIADISAFNAMYTLSYAEKDGIWSDYPNIQAWFQKKIKPLKSYDKIIEQQEDVFKKMYQEARKKLQQQSSD